jgi:hypothetical protein
MTAKEKASAILNTIAEQAKNKWGEEWLAEIVRTYCEIEEKEEGSRMRIKPVNRRGQILRAFQEGSTTLPTLCRLAEAVGINLKLELISKKTLYQLTA